MIKIGASDVNKINVDERGLRMEEEMINTPLVSVIIPTYNNFSSIFKLLDSILIQKYENIELIISDDGSVEFPSNIEEYINSRNLGNIKKLLIINNKENKGTVKNLNSAIKQTYGKYIIPIAGDDVFYDNSVIEKLVNRFEKNNSNVIVTSRMVIDDNKPLFYYPHINSQKRIKRFDSKEKKYAALIMGMAFNMASGCALYYRKSFFDSIGGYDEKYCLWEDLPFMLNTLLVSDMCLAYDIISIYYSLGGVSNPKKINSKLKNDIEIYNRTDRIANLEKLPKIAREMTMFNIKFSYLNLQNKFVLLVKNPLIIIKKIIYKLQYTYDEKIDKYNVRKNNGKAVNNRNYIL